MRVDRDVVKARAHGRSDALTSPARLMGSLAFKVVALVVAAAVAILLWQFALRVVGYAANHSMRPTTTATVVECSRTLGVSGPCVVDFTNDHGQSQQADLINPGLFALSTSEQVQVVPMADGTAGMGGWSPVFDAGLLLMLAIAFTTYAIGWWRRVLEHDTPLYYGGDPDELEAYYDERYR